MASPGVLTIWISTPFTNPRLRSLTPAAPLQTAGPTRLYVRRSHFGDDFFHYAHGWADPVEMTMAEFVATFNESASTPPSASLGSDGGAGASGSVAVPEAKARYYLGQVG